MDADKLSAAHKKITAIDGISEQGAVPDPEVMHTLFAEFMAVVGPVGILPIILAANSVPNSPSRPRERHTHPSRPGENMQPDLLQ